MIKKKKKKKWTKISSKVEYTELDQNLIKDKREREREKEWVRERERERELDQILIQNGIPCSTHLELNQILIRDGMYT